MTSGDSDRWLQWQLETVTDDKWRQWRLTGVTDDRWQQWQQQLADDNRQQWEMRGLQVRCITCGSNDSGLMRDGRWTVKLVYSIDFRIHLRYITLLCPSYWTISSANINVIRVKIRIQQRKNRYQSIYNKRRCRWRILSNNVSIKKIQCGRKRKMEKSSKMLMLEWTHCYALQCNRL